MAVANSTVTVTTSATLLATGSAVGDMGIVSGTRTRVKLLVAGQTVEVGPSGVTFGTGWPITAGSTETFTLAPGETLYGIVTATTATVDVVTNDA